MNGRSSDNHYVSKLLVLITKYIDVLKAVLDIYVTTQDSATSDYEKDIIINNTLKDFLKLLKMVVNNDVDIVYNKKISPSIKKFIKVLYFSRKTMKKSKKRRSSRYRKNDKIVKFVLIYLLKLYQSTKKKYTYSGSKERKNMSNLPSIANSSSDELKLATRHHKSNRSKRLTSSIFSKLDSSFSSMKPKPYKPKKDTTDCGTDISMPNKIQRGSNDIGMDAKSYNKQSYLKTKKHFKYVFKVLNSIKLNIMSTENTLGDLLNKSCLSVMNDNITSANIDYHNKMIDLMASQLIGLLNEYNKLVAPEKGCRVREHFIILRNRRCVKYCVLDCFNICKEDCCITIQAGNIDIGFELLSADTVYSEAMPIIVQNMDNLRTLFGILDNNQNMILNGLGTLKRLICEH